MSAQIIPMPAPANHFRAYWRLGYRRLVPIIPPDAPISEGSTLFKRVGKPADARGKVPGIRRPDGNWFSYDWLASEADEHDLDRWAAMGAGVGIRTGDQGDGTSLLAIDADALSVEHATVIRDLIDGRLGRLPIRVGRSPKAIYLCRVRGSFRYSRIEFNPRVVDGKRSSERVEILSNGKQFVAAGIHPKTGRPYEWPRQLLPYDQLALFDAADIDQLLGALAAALPETRRVAEGAATATSQAGLRARDTEAVRRAVTAIPNSSNHFPQREDYVGLGYAIKAALPDDEHGAFAIFSEWCERWDAGTNDPDIVAADWGRMRPPFKRGAPWLYELATELGDFSMASIYFEPIADDAGGGSTPAAGLNPRDVFGDGDSGGVLEMPAGALPSVIENWAIDVSERMGAPPAFAAVAALATVSGAIGSKFRIQPKQRDSSWTEPGFLWFAIVEEPGGKKSPIIAAATAPLSAVDARRAKAGERAWAEWADRKSQRKRGEPLAPEPKVRRNVVEGFTFEALTGVLADNPAGVLVRQDELTQLIGSFDAYRGGKGGDRPMMLSLFDGRETRVDRVGKRHLHVPCWGAALVGGVQPRKISELANNLDADGLLQRFMVVLGDSERRRGLDRTPDGAAIAAYHAAIEELADLEPILPEAVTLSPAAHVVWQQMLDRIDVLADLPGLSDAWRGHMGKWPGFSARLLLICHVLDWVTDRLGFIDQRQVSKASASRAVKLVDWLLGNSLRFYAECIGSGEAGEDAKWIAGFILAHERDGLITRRDIGQARNELRDDPERVGRAMRFLEHMEWCTPDLTSRVDKHGPSRWTICPQVHALFASRADQERVRRIAERQKIDAAVAERRRLTEEVAGNGP